MPAEIDPNHRSSCSLRDGQIDEDDPTSENMRTQRRQRHDSRNQGKRWQ
ncbi:MAG: hypothetical protein LW687_06425 [Burkholderiaceae bacterium]|nr:hypothetical protein [Burkholderiaceae bacterium]